MPWPEAMPSKETKYPENSSGKYYRMICAAHAKKGATCRIGSACRKSHKPVSDWPKPVFRLFVKHVKETPGMSWNNKLVSPTMIKEAGKKKRKREASSDSG